MSIASVTIEFANTRSAPDDFLVALHTLETAFDVEAKPGEAPTPFEAYRSRYRSEPAFRDVLAWVAREDGTPVAAVTAELDRTGDNGHLVEAFAMVTPTHRRRGLGRRLLSELVETAEAENRRLLLGFTASSVPSGAAFMRRLGASEGLVERESELDLTRLDRAMVERWLTQGPQRASDYEILVIDGQLPEELLDAFAALYDATNSAPRDDLEVADSHRTPEQIREKETATSEAGRERILCLARHRPSGELAGWTELGRHPSEPWKIHQFWTVVHPDHRGHALGKWLKAANLARALERWPEAERIITGNAYSNAAMLGINNELGFAETLAWTVWQVPLTDVRAYLRDA